MVGSVAPYAAEGELQAAYADEPNATDLAIAVREHGA